MSWDSLIVSKESLKQFLRTLIESFVGKKETEKCLPRLWETFQVWSGRFIETGPEDILRSDQFQGLFDGPRDYGLVANLDYRAVQQARIGNYSGDYLVLRRAFGESELLKLLLLRSEQPEGGNAEFFQQRLYPLFVQRFVKVIDPVVIDAVFTKQHSQIAARGSGGFFVDGYLHN